MAEESDGIDEALDNAVRLAVMAGARVGSELARAHEDRLREQRQIDEREAGRLASRFEAEKDAALAQLAQVHRPDWWDRADPTRIGEMYAIARAWEADPGGAAAEERMRQEMWTRHGVHVNMPSAKAQAKQAARAAEPTFQVSEFINDGESYRRISKAKALQMIERLPPGADVSRAWDGGPDVQGWKGKDADVDEAIARKCPQGMTQEELDRVVDRQRHRVAQEETEAAMLLADADADADAETSPAYDSADRRAADAAALTATGVDPQVAESRMHADTAAGTPATAATTGARGGRAPKARTTRGRGSQAERVGVER